MRRLMPLLVLTLAATALSSACSHEDGEIAAPAPSASAPEPVVVAAPGVAPTPTGYSSSAEVPASPATAPATAKLSTGDVGSPTPGRTGVGADYSDPQMALGAYFAAWERGDVDMVLALSSRRWRSQYTAQDWRHIVELQRSWGIKMKGIWETEASRTEPASLRAQRRSCEVLLEIYPPSGSFGIDIAIRWSGAVVDEVPPAASSGLPQWQRS